MTAIRQVIADLKNANRFLRQRGAHGVHDARLGWADMGFESWAVGHWHVEGRDPADAGLELIETGLGDARGDLGGDAAALMGFVGDDDAMSFLHRR